MVLLVLIINVFTTLPILSITTTSVSELIPVKDTLAFLTAGLGNMVKSIEPPIPFTLLISLNDTAASLLSILRRYSEDWFKLFLSTKLYELPWVILVAATEPTDTKSLPDLRSI